MKKLFILVIMFILLLVNFISAETISLDPCGKTIIQELSNRYVMKNGCVYIELPKSYNIDEFFMKDLFNNENFELVLDSLEEINENNEFKKSYEFDSMDLESKYDKGFVYYYNDKVLIGYELIGNELEAFAEINNFNFEDSNSELFIKTRYIDTNHGEIKHTEPEINNIKSKEVDIKKIGEYGDKFYLQKIGRGYKIILDPIYIVDYSPIPAEWLINGSLETDPNSAFEESIDITFGISDNDDNTQYDIGLTPDVYVVWHLNEISGVSVFDSSGNNRDGTLINMEDGDWINGKLNNALQFDGVNEYVDLDDIAGFERTGKFSVEGWIKLTAKGIIVSRNKWSSPFNGWYIGTNPTGRLQFVLTNTWGTNQLSAYQDEVNMIDDNWHHFVITYDGSSSVVGVKFYVDGQLRTTKGSPSTLTGSILNSIDFQISGVNGINEIVTGLMDELIIYPKELTQEYALFKWNNGTGREFELLNKSIVGKWNQTYDNSYIWFVRIKKTTSGTENFSFYAYDDNDSISSIYETCEFSGVGWFHCNVSSLMDYMTNTKGLNYTNIRLFSDVNQNISEYLLRKEANDTEPPQIYGCDIDKYEANLTDVVRFSCYATDNLDVNNVLGTINNSNKTFQKSDSDFWYYDFTCLEEGNKSFSYAQAEDIVGLIDFTFPNKNLKCLGCDENWIAYYEDCIGGQKIKYYLDETNCGTFNDLPVDNGTFVGCGLNCYFEPEPHLKILNDKINVICYRNDSNITDEYFMLYLEKEGSIIASYPERVEIKEYGIQDKFKMKNGILNMYYEKKHLLPNMDFILKIKSGNYEDEYVIRPVYQDFTQSSIQRVLWTKRNVSYFVAIGLMMILAVILFYLFKSKRR